jgi:hypothetical protein
MSWLAGCRRLHRRYERKTEHFLAFTSIACTLICYHRLAKRDDLLGPVVGRLVYGAVPGRTGVRRAFAPDGDVPKPVAWLVPSGGGIEWTTPVRAIEPVTVPTPDRPSPQGR